MPDILLRSGELYIDKVRATLHQDLDSKVTQHLFPSLIDADLIIIKRLIASLIDIVPKLGDVIIDKDNLPDNRSIAAMAFTYLIMPFDILPAEQYGLLGYLDDALVAHTLAAQLIEPDESITILITASQGNVADLMTKLPEWFTGAIRRFASQTKEHRSNFNCPVSQIPHRRSYELF
jgi:uncharacterized membrane protein YkvA (DUF1232 family)